MAERFKALVLKFGKVGRLTVWNTDSISLLNGARANRVPTFAVVLERWPSG